MIRFWDRAFLDWTEGRRSPGLMCFGAVARPLSWLYRAGLALDARLRRIPTHSLPPDTTLVVLSSPLVGGVGKTPLAAHLVRTLLRNGTNVHLVTTGYGRSGRGNVSLTGRMPPVTAAHIGDEALMLHQMTGAPVHVSDDLGETVSRVETDFHPQIIIVDDGVRHRWQNERRIVVFAASDLARPAHLLPYGRWRIPPRRVWPAAGVAIIDTAPKPPAGWVPPTSILAHWGYTGPIGWYRTVSNGLVRLSDNAVSSLPDRRPFVFCGLGMPSRLLDQLAMDGFTPAGVQRFPDHHVYTATDLAKLQDQCRLAGGTWILTTHKDAVKIDPAWPLTIPVFWLRISLELTAGDDMLSVILEART